VSATLTQNADMCRDAIARAVRICNMADVMDWNGHVSMRDPDAPSTMWINSRNASRSTIRKRDIVPFDLDKGLPIGDVDEPPSEYHIHREIYRVRPDVGGIVHSHPNYILTLSIAGHPLLPVTASVGSFLPEAGAPEFDAASLINTEARGRALAAALGDAPMVVLRQHGAVTVGRTMKEAVVRMLCAEQTAMFQYQALQVGTPKYLRGEELRNLQREYWVVAVDKFWNYNEETARRAGALDELD
jgi:ribulose-5-phosphate 4-epimerase/fuculose-1-phosphate aldolase